MATAFDAAAAAYDQTFTHSVIGQYQRGQVYRNLVDLLETSDVRDILEINCGTGEDAAWLSRNYNVTATDISENMIRIAKTKGGNASFAMADINRISEVFSGKKFDLVFSNFGGLNCLSPLQLANFFDTIDSLLNENGKLALVAMPKSTLSERIYFLLKRNFPGASRRKAGSALANVDGREVETFYYNPDKLQHLAEKRFIARKLKPVGFFVPPSYLEPTMAKRPKFAAMLDRLDQAFNFSWLSKYADHYFITFSKR